MAVKRAGIHIAIDYSDDDDGEDDSGGSGGAPSLRRCFTPLINTLWETHYGLSL